MTIHSEHPFVPPEGERDPLRRLRGHLPAPVTVWAAGSGRERRGLTVSSLLVAAGDPAHVLGLVDEESNLWDEPPTTLIVNVLGPGHTYLAEAFAGTVPAPGGPFTLGEWRESEWGPVLADASAWLGVRLESAPPRHVGWGILLEGVVEHVETSSAEVLTHVRGRYVDGS
ncbi:flavin reductase family protein [Aeromicrobium sp.]|uniref:flavin reductase family protein n=1 Tax=Aeromicrobium sp. TaxID=1871063 RepID=UPI003D6A9AA3